MAKNYDFDYIIIGSGPAGRTAASKLAKAKKKVAIVEYQDFGGAELATRDLAYKLALDFANSYYSFTTSPAASENSHHFNFPTLLATSDNYINSLQYYYLEEFKKLGITLIAGFAHFIDSNTIAVEESKYTAKFFILATGSSLKVNEIAGLDRVKYLDPDTVLRVRRLPEYIFIIGGGSTGVEIAEYYAMLGSNVIIMERGVHLLPREDEEVGQAITNYFTNELGITVVSGAKVTAISEDYNSKIVIFTDGSSEKMVRVDTIVLATGSEPFIDYSLENAGVDYKRTGIIVDKYFSTTTKNIYAIGDCLDSTKSSTERSILQAHTLVNNLLHRQKSIADYSTITRRINTHPAVANVGLNERDATSRDLKYKKTLISLGIFPMLSSRDRKYGFIKLLTDHSNRLVGATIVADKADLIINELLPILNLRQGLEIIASLTHPTDSPAAALSLAAKKLLSK